MGILTRAAARRGGAVLIVEDEPLVRSMAADIFIDAGYRVLEAGNALEAITVLEGANDIMTVFTDIEMPGEKNGLSLAAEIKVRWPRISVLITSGRVRPDAAALPMGADFIAKPYLPREVINRIESIGPA
jgi:CheY-like chemotaxis protein